MSLRNFILNFDRDLAFTYKTAITADGYSSDIETGCDGSGVGVPLFVVVMVSAVGGTSPTLDITVCSKATASPTTSDAVGTMPQITANGMYHFSLPQNVKNFVNLNYNIGGTGTPTFTITAFLTTLI